MSFSSSDNETSDSAAADEWRPRYTLLGLLGVITALAGILGLLRLQATMTVVWLIATGVLYGSLGVAISHRAAWRRPLWIRLGSSGLITLAAVACLMAGSTIDPSLALVGALALLLVGTCLAFQLGIGEVLLTVLVLFLPAFLAVLSVGAAISWLLFGP
jgi:hypothetical protein